MIVLALDCSAAPCAACVYDAETGTVLGRAVRELGKGHAEHLMAVIAEALAQAGIGYGALDRIAVSVGPGSFTGIRVAVATARGLALALKIPAVGVTTLAALAFEAESNRPVLAVLDGGRGELHAALFSPDGAALREPAALPLDEAVALVRDFAPAIVGSASKLVAEAAGVEEHGAVKSTADILSYAKLGASAAVGARPAPLYLRAPDAKPQASFVLPRKD